ncbi:hypothetical protein [Streptomyces griseocarneus]|uniref:hypothetical protein n=1 Tax=Streptomyces griseocarneus TaxID=51201 RepID=UPI00167EE90E|nr:hypothetical protein [Streptomyces griseocarneus]MBZ6474349.1 hypothetical protein [Streptomyces griseocarneus]GHG53459.1 hypothetical protein GCM10018779_15460 [Streptomyces griseocarneus]
MNKEIAGRKVWTGAAIAASTAALLVEMCLAIAVLVVWGMTHPDPDEDLDSPAMAILAMPVWLGFLTVACLILTVALVMPSATLAHRAGSRWGGDDWWWTPAAAAVTSTVVVGGTGLAAGLGGHVGAPSVYAWWWLAIAVAIVPAGSMARLSARRAARGQEAGLVRLLLLNGCGGVAAFLIVAAIAGILWESVTG